ncbi:MAG TPA: CPBP family intramembrane glutamic endopeptidase [Terriglobales bacterium]|nr:CPBP family intramembrane glutamic endopeptidase [Terriglobales bacterium]
MQDAENQPLRESIGETLEQPAEPTLTLRSRHLFFFNQKGLRAGWRLLSWIGICIVFGIFLLSISAPIRHRLPRDIAADTAKLLVVAAILGGNAFMAKFERRSAWSYGLTAREWGPHFFFGVLIGWLSLTLMLEGMKLARHFDFGSQYMHGSALAVAAALNAFAFLFEVALFEEICFRGYALYTLAEGIGFWPASIVLSLLFAAAHLSNGGEAAVGIIAVVFFGLMICFSVWRTGSLFWAIGFHFMWDYSETFLYGVPDSGFVSPEHLLSAKFYGPAWITGGSVGPEGSWFIFVVLGLIALLIHFVYPRRQFQKP